MNINKRSCFSLRKSPYSLCGLTIALTLSFFCIYINFTATANTWSRYVDSKNSSRHLSLPDQSRHTSGTLAPGPATALPDLFCNPGEVNSTSCPDCLRPAVRQLQNIVKEIRHQDHLISNIPPGFFTVSPIVVQHLITDYLIEPHLECPYLLAVQPSILHRRYERDAIRNTWGSVAREQTWPNRKMNAKVNVLFVVASQRAAAKNSRNSNMKQFQEIQSEADQHGDILHINLADSYKSLTMKLLSAFKWVKDNCPCVKFVLKVDYDTFVNVPLLVDTLLYFENRFQFSIIGDVYTLRNNVFRTGRWKVLKHIYPMKSYPEYCSGCGYVLSYSALSQIVDAAPHFHIISVEDTFITGIMRSVVGCRLFSMFHLFTNYKDVHWNPCLMVQDDKLLGTGVDAQKHSIIWSSFVTGSCT